MSPTDVITIMAAYHLGESIYSEVDTMQVLLVTFLLFLLSPLGTNSSPGSET